MKTIWKYELPLESNEYGNIVIEMPKHSKIISTGVQNNKICIWAEVDNTQKIKENRVLNVVGTGKRLDEFPGVFLGTVQIKEFVWHVYISI